MMNYLLVAGGRNYENWEEFQKIVEANIPESWVNMSEIVIVEGGAHGTDEMAERFAKERGAMVKEFRADWVKYGRAAGPKRNDAMAKYIAENGGRALFFWDGRSKGTQDCIRSAKKRGLMVTIWNTLEGRYMEILGCKIERTVE